MVHNISVVEIALPVLIIHDAILQTLTQELLIGLASYGHGLKIDVGKELLGISLQEKGMH